MKIFLGILKKKNGEILHSHISESPDDSFYVEIWSDKGTQDPPMIIGSFRKWHHIIEVIEKNFPNEIIPIAKFKEINENHLMHFLEQQEDASIF